VAETQIKITADTKQAERAIAGLERAIQDLDGIASAAAKGPASPARNDVRSEGGNATQMQANCRHCRVESLTNSFIFFGQDPRPGQPPQDPGPEAPPRPSRKRTSRLPTDAN